MDLISDENILELSARQFNDDSIRNRDEAIDAAKNNICNFSKARVLGLTNCVSADEAIKLLIEFSLEFDSSPYFFIFIAKIEEEGIVTLDELFSLNNHINNPIIVQFAFPHTSRFFAKERVSDDFSEVQLCNSSSLSDPGTLCNNNQFSLSWLLSFLIHNQGDASTENLVITNFNLSNCHFLGETLLDHAVRRDSLLCLKLLNLFEWDLERQNLNGARILELAVKLGRYECLKILLEITETDQVPCLSNYQRRLLSLSDNRNYSLMMIAVENERKEIVKFLQCCNVDLNYKLKDNRTASDIAVNSEVLMELLRADAPFPTDCSRIFGEEEFLELIHKRTNYHKSIKSGNLDEVKKILKDNPNFKFLYNIKNQSALSTAIEHKKFEIYSFLSSQGFSNGIDQSLEALIMKLSEGEKNELTESKKKYFRDSASDHILLLLSRSRLGFDSINRVELFEKIKKFYEDLDEIPEINPILKIAANSKNLRIVFDFNHNHVYDLDPSQKPKDSRSTVQSVTYYTIGDILIGSRNDDRNSVLGTIAHELTHFVMNEIYSNQCKPFVLNDEVESRFTAIYENVMEISSEWIIKSVRNFSKENRSAELIVRVNHLLAYYKDFPSHIDQLRETHYKLFDFYDEITMPDLERKCEEIKRSKLIHLNDLISNIPDGVKRFFNDDFGLEIVTTGLAVIVSDSPSSSFLKLYQSFMAQQLHNVVVFAKLESLEYQKYFDLIKSQLLLSTNSVLVVVQFESVLKEESLSYISDITSLCSVQILIIEPNVEDQIPNNVPKFSFNLQHIWSDLTREYQNELLTSKITFQEKSIPLSDIFRDPNCGSLKDVPIEEIFVCKCLKVNIPHNPLTTFYIRRTFVMHSKGSKDVLDESKLIKLETGEAIVITDIAGMGKSVSLAHIASELVAKFPTHWVSFIDLKRYTKSFTKVNEMLIQENFADTFAREILELGTQLEQKIFSHLYREGRVILLLDGFDEISPIYNSFLLILIEAFHNYNKKNKLYITTRLHLLSELLKLNKSETHIELEPFSVGDQLDFLVKYWQSKSFEFSEQKSLELENHAIRILNKFIQSTVSNSLKMFTGVPLQIRMLAEIAEEKALSEAQPKEIDFKDEINFYEFYERFVLKLLEVWSGKSNLTISETIINIMKSVNIMKIHQGAALSFYFGTKICEVLKLPSIEDDQKEMIVRFGILQMNENSSVEFIHLTFADYFLANFILEASKDFSKFSENLEYIFEILIDILTADKHEKTRIFLEDALGNFSLATMKSNDSELFETVILKQSDFSILHQPIKFNQHNLIEFVTKLLANSNGKIDPSFFKQLLLDKNVDRFTAMHLIFYHVRSEEFLKRFFKLLEATFEKEELKLILNEKGHLGRNIFLQSLLNGNENISYELLVYLEAIITDKDELITFLCQRDEHSNTVFHLIASQFKEVPSFNKIFDALAELLGLNIRKEMLTHKNTSHNNVFLMSCFNDAVDIAKLVLEKLFSIFEPNGFFEILTSINEQGSNALHLIKRNPVEAVKCLMKYLPPDVMKTMMFQKTVDGYTPFNIALISSSDSQTVESLWKIFSKILPISDLKKLLLEKNRDGRTILEATCRNMNLDIWKTLFNITTTTLPLNEMKCLILNDNPEKGNILHFLGVLTTNPEIMKFVINEAEKILTLEFKSFLTAHCRDKNTPMHAIVSCNDNPKVAKVFWSIIEQKFSLEEQKELLKHLGFSRRHVMARSFESSNPNMAKYVWKIYKKNFDKETIEKLFINASANENIFEVASYKNNPFCVDLLEWSKDNMDPKRFELLLTERNDRGSTMLIDFVCFRDADFVEAFLIFVKKCFDIEFIRKLIYGKNTNGNNALISCLEARHKSVVAVYHNFLRTVLTTGEFDRNINEKNNNGMSFLDLFEGNIRYRQECDFILEKSMETVLENFHTLAFLDTDKDTTTKLIIYFIKSASSTEDLELKIFKTDSDGETALYKILKHNTRCHVFEVFWSIVKNLLSVEKQRELFNVTSDHQSNILIAAAMNESCNMMKPLMNILTTIYDQSEMREILMTKFDKSQTILHVIGRHNHNFSITETIMESLTVDEKRLFLTSVDSDGNMVMHTYAIFNKCFYEFTKYFNTIFSVSEQEEIFMLCNDSSKNILTCLISNSRKFFRFVWFQIVNKFQIETLIKILLQCDLDGFNAIQLMILDDDDYCGKFLNWFKNNCPDYKNVLLQKVKNKSFLSLVASSCQHHIIIMFCEFLKENFKDLKEIILDKDGAGNNVLMYAVSNKFEKSFETILNFLKETLTNDELLQLITDKNMFDTTILNVIKIDATQEIFRKFCIGNFGEETFDICDSNIEETPV